MGSLYEARKCGNGDKAPNNTRQIKAINTKTMQTKELNGFIVHRVYTNLVNSYWCVIKFIIFIS